MNNLNNRSAMPATFPNGIQFLQEFNRNSLQDFHMHLFLLTGKLDRQDVIRELCLVHVI